ncbi:MULTISPECIES: type IV conjugative transfer system protein TraL [Erwinia]|uniref:TraL protein n=1 Tax=Erwinia tasmaniensis (strain DSM 17950 / CFBP 7177 / CIP 109463 / NCPPB 4357 / Et1/99) TaxID=465817 RepID=B2VB06_ERWT9|nr:MULTISPECIES: type IV conjugative transfer system protein TraL [Erwinia]MCK8417591.1 type IV conjugative transfer system protein TraL [Erwinia amylovora]CAO94954.1 TraL protein [Erwinia tasmaniensis Et1/99]
MSGTFDKYTFPETINEQNRIFGLPVDEVAVIATPVICGVAYSCAGAMCLLAALLWVLLRYLKKGKGSQFMADFLYWNLPYFLFRPFFRKIPSSGNRHWVN